MLFWAIQSFWNRASNGELADDQHRPLRRMLRAGEHLLSLIENTLSYAKLELGVEKLHIVNVDAQKIIGECIEQLQPIAEEQGHSSGADRWIGPH